MTTNILGNLFGSESKVKMMRLFLFNPTSIFDLGKISERTRCSEREVKKEIQGLEKIGLIKKKTFIKTSETKKGKIIKILKKKIVGWSARDDFKYLEPLKNLLIEISPYSQEEIIKNVGKTGAIKLLVVSGVFNKNPEESRVDIFVVGDKIKKPALSKVIKSMESEIGKELRYTAFETPDFHYRVSMYDKLIRDILEYPHKKLVNKLGIE